MSRDAVIVSLSEKYNLSKTSTAKDEAKGIETWSVMEKAGPGVGWLSFSGGAVRRVVETLTATEMASPQTGNFAKDLIAYLKPEMKPYDAGDGALGNRRAAVVIELEETQFRQEGMEVNMSTLKVKFKDVSYQLFCADAAGIGRTDLRISRIRGTE
jgi:hypothetical protein